MIAENGGVILVEEEAAEMMDREGNDAVAEVGR